MSMSRQKGLPQEPSSDSLSPAPKAVRARLIRWSKGNFRSFPWRRTEDPYAILLAEVLLRKTAARSVPPVYSDLLRKCPTPQTLADSSVGQLKRVLAPLGLSNQRAAQMVALGAALVSHGGVPPDAGRLATLPGVGPYTAGAVTCFAFGKPSPMVDTNIARVISRVFAITPSRFEARRCPEIWRAARALTTRSRAPRTLNWAILDLAAAVCRPRSPLCARCPLGDICQLSLNSPMD